MTIPELLSNFILVTTVMYSFFLVKKNNAHKLLDLAVAFVITITISEGLKYFLNIPRPENIYQVEGSSFPSTHSAISACAILFTFLVLHKFHEKHHFFNRSSEEKVSHGDSYDFIILIIMGILVILSRIMMNVHTWYDVIGGIFVGLIAVIPFMYYDISGRRIK